METQSFTGLELQREYQRTLLALRIGCTASILLSGSWLSFRYAAVHDQALFLDDMIVGGINGLPAAARMLINYADHIAVLAALGGAGALAWLWSCSRRISKIASIGIGATLCFLIIGAGYDLALMEPVVTVIHNFGA